MGRARTQDSLSLSTLGLTTRTGAGDYDCNRPIHIVQSIRTLCVGSRRPLTVSIDSYAVSALAHQFFINLIFYNKPLSFYYMARKSYQSNNKDHPLSLSLSRGAGEWVKSKIKWADMQFAPATIR